MNRYIILFTCVWKQMIISYIVTDRVGMIWDVEGGWKGQYNLHESHELRCTTMWKPTFMECNGTLLLQEQSLPFHLQSHWCFCNLLIHRAVIKGLQAPTFYPNNIVFPTYSSCCCFAVKRYTQLSTFCDLEWRHLQPHATKPTSSC